MEKSGDLQRHPQGTTHVCSKSEGNPSNSLEPINSQAEDRTNKCTTPDSRFYSSRACMNPVRTPGPWVMLCQDWTLKWQQELCPLGHLRIYFMLETLHNVAVIPPVRRPPAGPVRSSQRADATPSALSTLRLDGEFVENQVTWQRWKSQLAALSAAEKTKTSSCVLNMPCVIIYSVLSLHGLVTLHFFHPVIPHVDFSPFHFCLCKLELLWGSSSPFLCLLLSLLILFAWMFTSCRGHHLKCKLKQFQCSRRFPW